MQFDDVEFSRIAGRLREITPLFKSRSRHFRKFPTKAEEAMWQLLKNDATGYRFRRQHKIGPFIADFFCFECRLVIEVDGSVHFKQPEEDRLRTEWLEGRGIEVIRFWNWDILLTPEKVVAKISAAIKQKIQQQNGIEKLSPDSPSPPRGGGGAKR